MSEYLTKRNNMLLIYLEFCKAFDTVSHYRLIVEMKILSIYKIYRYRKMFLMD